MRHPRRLAATPHPQSGTTWGWNPASPWTQGDGVGMGEGPTQWWGAWELSPWSFLCCLGRCWLRAGPAQGTEASESGQGCMGRGVGRVRQGFSLVIGSLRP